MLEKWIKKCIRRPIATLMVFVAITVAGIYALLQLPLEVLPSVDFPRLYIQTSWPGASAESVERDLTSLIEAELTQLRGIANIRSESREGSSRIDVELQPDADVEFLRFLIREKLAFLQERLPEQAYPPQIIKYVPEEMQSTRFMSYQVVGPYSDADLRHIALNRIRPVINSIPGVAGTEVIGGRERQIEIRFRQEQLQAYQLSSVDLLRVLREAGQIYSAGHLVEGGRHSVVLRQPLRSQRDLRTLPIKKTGNRLLYLRDVATVVDTLSPPFSFQRINGRATVLLRIEKEPQANTIEVADAVYQTVARLPERLPQGIELIKEDDESVVIRQNLRQLTIRALFSFLVILLVLTLFFRQVQFALLIQATVMLSVLATLLLMFLSRTSLNLITLAGLALGFGMLVDNAIVVLENIVRRTDGVTNDAQLAEASAGGTAEMALPLMAATLTTLASLVPFLMFMDELRLYYTPFAVTVALALIASLAVSFFLIPTVYQKWHSRHVNLSASGDTDVPHRKYFDGRLYERLLRSVLQHPVLTVVVTVWIFGLPLWKLPSSLDSEENQPLWRKALVETYNATWGSKLVQDHRTYIDHIFGGSLHLFYRYVSRGEIWRWRSDTKVHAYISLPPGTDIAETDAIVQRMEATVSGIDGIAQVRSRIYPTYAHVEVRFTPEAQRSVSPFMVKEKLIARAAQTGNARVSVVGYGPGFSSGGGGITMQNRLELTGYNYRQLSQFADNLKQRLERYPRVRDVRTDLTRGFYLFDTYETLFRLNRRALAAHRIDAGDIMQQTRPYLSQFLYRQRLRIGWEEVPFQVVSENYRTLQWYQLQQLQVNNSRQQRVRLGELGTLQVRRIQPVIERKNQNYYKLVTFDYLAPYRFANEFTDRFVAQTTVPVGFSLKKTEFRWDFGEKQRDITGALLLALLLMYMVLAGLYESFTYPFLIFLIIPLSLIGVFMAYYLTATTFDQAAYIGVIFLLGIVLNNGILLVDRINHLRYRMPAVALPEIIAVGCRERMRPILITSLTTIAGLLPLLLLSDQSSEQDLWQTLSLSTIGGLISSVVLGLLVLPVLLLLVEGIRNRARRYFRTISK